MADSLREQLLKSGIVKKVREQPRTPSPKGGRPKPATGTFPTRSRAPGAEPASRRHPEEIDLAKAYAIRAQTDAQERKRAEREAAEQARLKRERKLKVQRLLEGQSLNGAEADLVRHFEYAGKIRRVHVDEAQLTALNAGELGVVQQAGRYVLVSRAIAEQVRAIDAHLVALLVDPAATTGLDEDGVPDDLVW